MVNCACYRGSRKRHKQLPNFQSSEVNVLFLKEKGKQEIDGGAHLGRIKKIKKQAQLCNKLRLCRHLMHKRWAWPAGWLLGLRPSYGPSARLYLHLSGSFHNLYGCAHKKENIFVVSIFI